MTVEEIEKVNQKAVDGLTILRSICCLLFWSQVLELGSQGSAIYAVVIAVALMQGNETYLEKLKLIMLPY